MMRPVCKDNKEWVETGLDQKREWRCLPLDGGRGVPPGRPVLKSRWWGPLGRPVAKEKGVNYQEMRTGAGCMEGVVMDLDQER